MIDPTPSTDPPAETLRRELLDLIDSRPDDSLPSMAELRRILRVGMHPLAKALQGLRDQGVLKFRRGGPMRIVGKPPKNPPVLKEEPSWRRLFTYLRGEIEGGRLQPGRALPKLQFHAIRQGLSQHTVHRAYRALEAGRWVHRQGRLYLVGPAPRPAKDRGRPCLILVEPDERAIRSVVNPRTGPFVDAVLREAQVSDIRLIRLTLSTNPKLAFMTLDGVVEHVGEAEMLRLIRGLGNRYLGTLIFGIRARYPGLPSLMKRLIPFQRPILWLDQKLEGTGTAPSPWIHLGRLDERSVARVAIVHLAGAGHRRIGYFGFGYELKPWYFERKALLREESGLGPVAVALVAVDEETGPFYSLGREAMEKVLADLWAGGVPHCRKALAYLAWILRGGGSRTRIQKSDLRPAADFLVHWPTRWQEAPEILSHSYDLFTLLLRPDISAVLGCNDQTTRRLYVLLRRMGISIPEDISLLSIDNYLNALDLPVSTVDWGAGELGWRMFHFASGRVRVKADGPGLFLGQARVVDRGTVLPPSRSPGIKARP